MCFPERGFFEDDEDAKVYVGRITQEQKKLWKYRGFVPLAFWEYLEYICAIEHVPEKREDRKVGDLLEALWEMGEKHTEEKSPSASIRKRLLVEKYPELKKATDLGESVFKRFSVG